jgi:peptidoglycan/LPS O-acetylase OafA/YrhL
VLLALLGLSLGLRVWAYSLGYSHEPWRYRFFPFEFAMFMAGALSYRIYAATKQIRIPPWVLWTVFILFTSLTLGYDLIHSDYRTKQIIYYVLLVVLMPFIFRLTKNFKWDRWIAEISFPVFLLHFLFVHLLSFLFDLSPLGITVLVLATTVAVSVMVKMWFMDPLEAYRQKRTRARL